MNTNTTPSGADAIDVAMSKACIHSWDQSQFTSGDCDAVHPMFSRAFEAGYRAALSAAQDAPVRAAQAVPQGLEDRIEAAIQRIVDNHAPRRIPADPTDVDLVLAEFLALIRGKWPPFWIHEAAPAAPPPAAQQGDALSYVYPVPDHCDRVVWRNRYLHLAAQAQEAVPAAQGEPSDTERMDWLATHAKRLWHSGDGYYLHELRFRWGDSLISRTLREAVDDARAAQQEGASNG